MQIQLYISEYPFSKFLKKRINKINDLKKYTNIIPKSIQINTKRVKSALFVDKLFELFDISITSFNEIECQCSAENSRLISFFAKKVRFRKYENDDESNMCETNYYSVTEHLVIEN